MGMEWMMGPWWMGGTMWIGWLLGLISLALVALGVVVGIQWLVRGAVLPATARRSDSALDVLRERFVRGDVERDEFERVRQDLS